MKDAKVYIRSCEQQKENKKVDHREMTLRKQVEKLKEHWFLVLIIIVILLFFSSCSALNPISKMQDSQFGSLGIPQSIAPSVVDYAESYGRESSLSIAPSPSYGDFAPDVEERVLTKTASMTTEVKRGTFDESAIQLKNVVSSSDAFLLNEQVNKYGVERKQYYQGMYQVKVATNKYDAVVAQLKQIGEVTVFSENTLDVTGRKVNTELNIEAERARLERYKQMFGEAERIEDKITLNDRIFSQERTIKHLEDSLQNLGQQVDYSSLHVTLTEKQSEHVDTGFIKFSDIIKSFVNSINRLLWLVFVLIPWVVAYYIIRFFVRKSRKRR